MHAPTSPALRDTRAPPFGEFVALVALMMGITAFAVDNVLPAFPPLASHFGVADPNRLQLVVYVYILGFGLFQIVYGPASDILGRRPAFLVGLAIYGAGSLLAATADSFEVLLVARFIQGAGGAAGRVISVAITRDRFEGREMARVMSLTMMVFITVPIFAPAIGTLILYVGDWHAIFATMVVLSVMLGVWFALRMPETLRPENRVPASVAGVLDGMRQTVRSRAAFGYSTAFGCLFGCIMAYVGSAQQILAGPVYGLGNMFTVVFGGVAVMMGLAALLNSRLVRRYGMHRISHIGMLALLGLSVVQCGLALAFAGHPPLLLFCAILGASQFAMSLVMPNFNALAMQPLGHVAGTASSLIGCYTTVLGAVLGGLIGQHFDGTVLPLGFGYLALSLIVVLVVIAIERGRLFGTPSQEAA